MEPKVQALFSKEFGNAENYRIPALAITKHGTLVACCDERFFSCSDNPNRIDKVVRRSTDGGVTWSAQQTIVEEVGSSKLYASASIDASLLYDETHDRIWMLWAHTPSGIGILNASAGRAVNQDGYKLVLKGGDKFYLGKKVLMDFDGKPTVYQVSKNGDIRKSGEYVCNVYTGDGEFKEYPTFYLYINYSDDDGVTWSTPRCLNGEVKEDYYSFIGAGPGRGIAISKGAYKGRLVFPMYYNVTTIGLKLSCALIYSDDNGKSWKLGKSPNSSRRGMFRRLSDKTITPAQCLTESQVIETPNGLRLFMRNHAIRRQIATADSVDGGVTWKNFRFHEDLPQCICQCSVITFDYNGETLTAFLNAADKNARKNGVIRLSRDYGDTFFASRTLKSDGFVYSSMAYLGDGIIGVAYEPSTEHFTIDYVRLSVEWICSNTTDGEQKL